jgi:hypothetical protein
MTEAEESRQNVTPSVSAPEPPNLLESTAVYLRDKASESFSQFNELDESVWRSLPFFAAVFGFAATLIASAIPALLSFDWSLFSWLTHGLLALSVASFGWAFRWFVAITKRRTYEYPADDGEIRGYAEQLTAYHGERGLAGTGLDAKVVHELILVEGAQLADAAKINGVNARERLNARSLTLQFMMIGFGLALANSVTMFVYQRSYGNMASAKESVTNASANSGKPKGHTADAGQNVNQTDASSSEHGGAGRRFLDKEQQSGNAQEGQIMAEESTPVPQPSPSPKPAAPTPQRLEKSAPPPPQNR